MKNFMLFTSVLLVMCFISSGFSQIVVGKAGIEVKVKPKEEPKKTYDLTPKFTKDMTWSETVECSNIQNIEYEYYTYKRTQTVNFKCKVQLSEFEKDAPKKIQYTEIKGKNLSTYSWDGDDSSDPSIEEIKDGSIKCKIIANNYVDVEESKNIEDIILTCYPAGPYFGFVPPTKAVKVGEEWKADKLAPVNFKQADEIEDFEIDDITGKFKLISVTLDKDKEIEIAEISWIGSGEGEVDSNIFSASWTRTIKYDLTNKRTLSNDGSLKLDLIEYGNVALKLKQVFDYAKNEAPKADNEPEQPKGEED